MVLAIFAVCLAWRLLRALVLYPFGSWNVFGTTSSARLLGLGVAAIITPRAVEKLIVVPAAFFLRLVEGLTRQAANVPLSFSPSATERTISIHEPLIRLSLMVVDGVAEVGRAFSQALDGLLTPDVVIALAIWVLTGRLLSAADPAPNETPSMAGANRLYRYLKARRRQGPGLARSRGHQRTCTRTICGCGGVFGGERWPRNIFGKRQ
jgi:hypothetical protein